MPPETPLAFGLHPNAEIGFKLREAETFCNSLVQLQPRESGGGCCHGRWRVSTGLISSRYRAWIWALGSQLILLTLNAAANILHAQHCKHMHLHPGLALVFLVLLQVVSVKYFVTSTRVKSQYHMCLRYG